MSKYPSPPGKYCSCLSKCSPISSSAPWIWSSRNILCWANVKVGVHEIGPQDYHTLRHMICLVSLVDPVPWRWTEQAFTTLAQACVAPCPSKCAGNCYHCSVQLPSTTILWTLNTFMTKSKTPRSQQHMDSMPGRHRAGSQKSHLLVKESGGPSMQGSRAEPMCHHEDVRLWCWMCQGRGQGLSLPGALICLRSTVGAIKLTHAWH